MGDAGSYYMADEAEPCSVARSNTLLLADALEMAKGALAILDAVSAPAEIGANLDLVVCRIQQLISVGSPAAPSTLLVKDTP